MDVPGIVRERLGDEQRLTSVNVGGDDRVYVTPPRTLVYHASGLFSRESIEEYPHDADRFDVSADRREATFAFEYDDGVAAFSIPRERVETVLPPVLAGVLRSSGWIDDDESIEESYRFGERTLVVTDRRLLTSVGEAVWDRDHESDDYANVTGLDFEGDGLVIEVDGRSRRIDLADEGAREAYETLEHALCEYYGIDSVEALTADRSGTDGMPSTDDGSAVDRTEGIADAESEGGSTSPPRSPAPEGRSPDAPIPEASNPDRSGFETTSVAESESSAGPNVDDAGTETSADPDVTVDDTDGNGDVDSDTSMATAERSAVADELGALRESVERQTELMERNQELLERLVDGVDEERATDDR